MFVPTETKHSKKNFKKPNILRKKSKTPVTKLNPLDASESLNLQQLLFDTSDQTQHDAYNEVINHEIQQMDNAVDGNSELISHISDDNNLMIENNNISNGNIHTDIKSEEHPNQAIVNIEAFFNNSPGENVMLYDFDPGKPIEAIMLIDDPESSLFIEQNPDDIEANMEVLSAVPVDNEKKETPVQNLYSVPKAITKFKCDIGNCKKEFRSEQKFLKHQNNHNEDGSVKPSRQITVECPVKNGDCDSPEKGCGKIFLVRELLLKHLNEEHTPEDASYRCDECGRRFFWASGLRAHVRAHCRRAGGALACAWPGCARVFAQPCRLREHARSHTGDRPYPCRYPGCGWSFRSASKLERHARRHSAERRHECGACGRGFRRRDHLRDHHARHHATPRATHACAHPGCEMSFNNMSTLYLHMKRVHKSKDSPETVTAEPEPEPEPEEADTFLVDLNSDVGVLEMTECEVSDVGGEAAVDEDRAARTHCTWPLRGVDPAPGPASFEAAPTAFTPDLMNMNTLTIAPEPAPSPILLHDHYTVEQSEENSESNIYTVRSDLFLHGNVMINEDSQQSGAVQSAVDSIEHDLLLDTHPTGDLMQEELLYTDAVGDESSFRIFLLSSEAEELS